MVILLARTLKSCDQPVCGLVMVPVQSRLPLISTWVSIQLPLFGALVWYLCPLLMKETQNSVPWVEASWAKRDDVAVKSAAIIRNVVVKCFMALMF